MGNTRYATETQYAINGEKIGYIRLEKLNSKHLDKYFNFLKFILISKEKFGYPPGFNDCNVEIVGYYRCCEFEFMYLNSENELCREMNGKLILIDIEKEHKFDDE
jgi:hypothetical protein